jgi:hypothetical protein
VLAHTLPTMAKSEVAWTVPGHPAMYVNALVVPASTMPIAAKEVASPLLPSPARDVNAIRLVLVVTQTTSPPLVAAHPPPLALQFPC